MAGQGSSSLAAHEGESLDPRDPDGRKWRHFVHQLRQFQSLATDIKAEFLVVNLPQLDWRDRNYKYADFNNEARKHSILHGIRYFDMLQVLQEREPEAYWYSRCDHHYNALAHSVVADTTYRYLLEKLNLR